MDPIVQDFTDACKTWAKITEFLQITTIDDEEEYRARLNEFKVDIKKLYKYGKTTFLTIDKVDNSESYYTHAIWH